MSSILIVSKVLSIAIPPIAKKIKTNFEMHRFEKQMKLLCHIAYFSGCKTQEETNKFFELIETNSKFQEHLFELLDTALRTRSMTARFAITLLISKRYDETMNDVLLTNDDYVILNALERITEHEISFFWYIMNNISNKIYSKEIGVSPIEMMNDVVPNAYIFQYQSETIEIIVKSYKINFSNEGVQAILNDFIGKRIFLPYNGPSYRVVGMQNHVLFNIGRITEMIFELTNNAISLIDSYTPPNQDK
jgi:hypothetical protein